MDRTMEVQGRLIKELGKVAALERPSSAARRSDRTVRSNNSASPKLDPLAQAGGSTRFWRTTPPVTSGDPDCESS